MRSLALTKYFSGDFSSSASGLTKTLGQCHVFYFLHTHTHRWNSNVNIFITGPDELSGMNIHEGSLSFICLHKALPVIHIQLWAHLFWWLIMGLLSSWDRQRVCVPFLSVHLSEWSSYKVLSTYRGRNRKRMSQLSSTFPQIIVLGHEIRNKVLHNSCGNMTIPLYDI